MRRWCTSIVGMLTVLLGLTGTAHSQPSITFDNVAGKWSGHANTYKVSLEIDRGGRFLAKSPMGSERGEARIENGSLVIPLPGHHGNLQLVREGDSLKGPGYIDGKTWDVTLARAVEIAD